MKYQNVKGRGNWNVLDRLDIYAVVKTTQKLSKQMEQEAIQYEITNGITKLTFFQEMLYDSDKKKVKEICKRKGQGHM